MKRIVTYTNPFELKRNPELWSLITNHPHYCASDTLVQGLNHCYGRENFSILRPLQDLIDAFFKEYTSNPVNDMQTFLKVSDCIRSWDDSTVKEAFLFNKAEVVQAIQLLIPLKCETEDFDRERLSEEQKRFLSIYDTVISSNCYDAFKNIEALSFGDYKQAVCKTACMEVYRICRGFEEELGKGGINVSDIRYSTETALKAIDFLLGKFEKSANDVTAEKDQETNAYYELKRIRRNVKPREDEFYKTVIIDGVHRITPINYYLFKKLESVGVNVVFLINYAKNVPAVYQTWKKVYEWTETPFEYEGNIDFEEGTPEGKAIAFTLAGLPTEKLNKEYIQYDNLSAFTTHEVSPVYDAAKEKRSKDPLAFMKTQYYAVNGEETNEILQMYYPEQFEQKPFLSYPIGQLILGIYQMYDPAKGEMHFNFKSLSECAVSGVFYDKSRQLMRILKKLELYFDDIETIDEYKNRIQLIRDTAAFIRQYVEYDGLGKISFFSLEEDEIAVFENFIESLNEYASKIFLGSSGSLEYIEHFKNLISVIESPSGDGRRFSSVEKELVDEIKARLESQQGGVYGNNEDVGDALAFFLHNRKDKDSSNWIVRDFEQIDGGVLLSKNNDRVEKYQFALLSNEHMLTKISDELPWPLTDEMFYGYGKAQNAISAFCTSRQERRSFLRYILFYGVFFSKKPIEFSFVEEEKGNKQTLYYVLDNLGLEKSVIKVKPAITGVNLPIPNGGNVNVRFSKEASEMFSVCPYKFLIYDVFKAPVEYYSEFHIKYYLTFLVAKITKEMIENWGNRNQDAVEEKVIENLQKYIPFWGRMVFEDIKNRAKKYLVDSSNWDDFCRRKENFLVARWREDDYRLDFYKHWRDRAKENYMRDSRLYPQKEDVPPKDFCNYCCYSSICLRNFYDANAESE